MTLQAQAYRGLQVAIDIAAVSVAYWLAFLFRFEFAIPSQWVQVVLRTWPYIATLHFVGLAVFRVPQMSWRYISMRDIGRILAAISVTSSLLVIARFASTFTHVGVGVVGIPLGVILMAYVLGFLGLVGARSLRRLHGEALERRRQISGKVRHRVLLIGAGQAGVMVAREIARRPDLGLHSVGFIDDDLVKIGTSIGGVPVLGTTKDVAAVAERKHVSRALITIANASGTQIRRITELCRDARLETKIIPGIYELVGGTVNLSRIREIAIEDLLGRAPVQLDEDVVCESIRSRVVVVTGAGGSIGSELCRQVCRFGPARLILIERYENALFEIHRELTSAFPQVPIDPRVGDITDTVRMEQIFAESKPDTVFHAAAHKHVPMMEWNPGEAIKNNVGGTRVIADLSDRHAVQRFVLISTDKAVNPTSIMGASKRIAESYVQALARRSQTKYVTVRFGNVLGSAGSVIPIFRDQIARGGPVTVTHPEMCRYFMTIPEASQLVLQAGAMGDGGEVFILDMGEPVRIVDLARDLIMLSGLRPNDDIEIRFTGVRPGEKLFEELSTKSEHTDKTKHPKIFVGRVMSREWDEVTAGVDRLCQLAHRGSSTGAIDELRLALTAMIPEFRAPAAKDASKQSHQSGSTSTISN